MPVLDGDFEAFVTNLGKYNEGELVGEWVKLPTTEEEMKKVFERIGIGSKDEFGQPYEEWFITDYECPIYGVQKMLGEYALVCGITDTLKLSLRTSATVRLIPSNATEPFSTIYFKVL